jgi:hypothetical protein
VGQAPARPDLREFADFEEQFYIEDLLDQDSQEDQTWTFVYRLKPKYAQVELLPSVPLIYYQPGLRPELLGYMTRYAPAIPLKVRPRGEVQPNDIVGSLASLRFPQSAYQFEETESRLLADQSPYFPSGGLLIGLAILPPILCGAWYAAWRSMYPDAALKARRRRSRAAQLAIKNLKKMRSVPLPQQTEKLADLVVQFLQQRFDLPMNEPTRVETAAHLAAMQIPLAIIDQTADFLRRCDSQRFQPDVVSAPLFSEAERLINALEEAAWN